MDWGFPRFTPDFLLNTSHLVPGSTPSETIASLRHLLLFFHPDATVHDLTSTVEVIQPFRHQNPCIIYVPSKLEFVSPADTKKNKASLCIGVVANRVNDLTVVFAAHATYIMFKSQPGVQLRHLFVQVQHSLHVLFIAFFPLLYTFLW